MDEELEDGDESSDEDSSTILEIDMESRRPLDEELEDEDESSDEDFSIVSEVDSDTSSNGEDAYATRILSILR